MSDASELIQPDTAENTSGANGNMTHSRQDGPEVRQGNVPAPPVAATSPEPSSARDGNAADVPAGDTIAAGSVAAEDITAADIAEFEHLFTAYADRLCRYINRYVKVWAEAEELVQDVFLKLWQRRTTLGPVRDMEAFLYTHARYCALNYLRHRRVEEREASRCDPDAYVIEGTEIPGEIQAAIQRAVDTLPPRQREVLVLRWRDQASYREIMARLDISEQTVGTHLRRALDQLREILPRLL